jgi:hypothetical protein
MKRIFIVAISCIAMLAALFTSGCSALSSTSEASAKILRQSPIGAKWQMYQLQLTVPAGSNIPVVLELAEGSQVDGYFYVESGDNSIDFTITGLSQMYKSTLTNMPTGTPVSDRFSFTASQAAQGLSYNLTFTNNNAATSKTKSTIFLEVMYPGDGPLLVPMK